MKLFDALMPRFYAIGLRCCDHGGHVVCWYADWAINKWREDALFNRWNGSGDGEVYQRISLSEYLRLRYDFCEEHLS